MKDYLEDLYSCYENHIKNCKGFCFENYSKGYYLNPANTGYKHGGIILYGQEPNGWDKTFDSYAEGIEDIINNRKMTHFCKKIQEVWEQGGLINNIAKFATSTNGKHPPVSQKDTFWKKMYEEFEFNGEMATIYQHELEILKPKKILLLCGPGRKRAVKLAFQFKSGFIDEYIPHLNKAQCANRFEHNSIEFMYALHPQAHMNSETRKEYDEQIEDFLKNKV